MQATSTDFTSPINERVLEVFPGVYSGILSICPKEDITIINQQLDDPNEEYWSLIFMLEGEIELTSFVKDKPISNNFIPNTFSLFHAHSYHASCSFMKKTQTSLLGITLNSEHLKQFLEVNNNISLNNMMCTNEPVALNVNQKRILRQMFSSTKQGMAYSLYLQGKTIELLAEFIESVLAQAHGCYKKYELCLIAEEINCIESARHILENNMMTPPCLSELSNLVGLDINKLKRGFRDMYNTTPYAFLHEARMLKSGNLLANSAMNVSQVAWEVGYSSLGHFSESFQIYYGVNPKEFQMTKAKDYVSKLKIAKLKEDTV